MRCGTRWRGATGGGMTGGQSGRCGCGFQLREASLYGFRFAEGGRLSGRGALAPSRKAFLATEHTESTEWELAPLWSPRIAGGRGC